jgi:nucleoside-diphosphate-sugar epimerase
VKLVVFGASGATGRHLGSLAAAAGWSVRAFLRSEEARGRVGGAKETVVGDPTDPAVVAAAIRGADAVAVCLGNSRRTRSPFAPLVSPPDLTSRTVASILRAMRLEGVRRIVDVSEYGARAGPTQMRGTTGDS